MSVINVNLLILFKKKIFISSLSKNKPIKGMKLCSKMRAMKAQLSPTPSLVLAVRHADGHRSMYRTARLPIVVGRGGNSNLVLSDSKVSRHHLRIDYRSNCIVIEDLGSKNGTYIDDRRVPPRKLIMANGHITVGRTRIALSLDSGKLHGNVELLTNKPKPSPPSKEAETRIDLGIARHPQLKIEPLPHSARKIISHSMYQKFAEIAAQKDIAAALQTLRRKAMHILPVIKNINYLFFRNNSFFLENFTATANSEFPTVYNIVRDEERGVLLKSVGDLEIVKKAIIPIKSCSNMIMLVDIDINRRLSSQQMEKLLELNTLIDFCAAALESSLLRDELNQVFVKMLETIVGTVEAKDTYTYGHSERVCRYATVIGEEMQLSSEQKKNLIVSALCHDIGKIAIPDAIIKKPTRLNFDEYEDMKTHTNVGAAIVRNIPDVEKFIGGIKHHHERWDGTGYPDGLRGDNIPLFARIIAIVDAFDAMTSGRNYIGFVDGDVAADRLVTESRELFDPEILQIFAKACHQGRIRKEHDTCMPST